MLLRLILLSSILLSGRVGKSQSDTVRCFGQTELRKIALAEIRGTECQNLLDITNKQLKLKMEIVSDQDSQIKILKKITSDKDSIIVNKEDQLVETKTLLRKEHRKKNWTKIGWITSVIVLVTLLVLKS